MIEAALRVAALFALVGAFWWAQIWFHDWDRERQKSKEK